MSSYASSSDLRPVRIGLRRHVTKALYLRESGARPRPAIALPIKVEDPGNASNGPSDLHIECGVGRVRSRLMDFIYLNCIFLNCAG
jgi:hypothetical protein